MTILGEYKSRAFPFGFAQGQDDNFAGAYFAAGQEQRVKAAAEMLSMAQVNCGQTDWSGTEPSAKK